MHACGFKDINSPSSHMGEVDVFLKQGLLPPALMMAK
jgi:hypothetical protein